MELADGSVIDPIIGGKRNPGGFFKSKEVFEKRLEAINSGGTSIIIKQIKNIINPPEGSSKNGESVSSLVEPSTSPSI